MKSKIMYHEHEQDSRLIGATVFTQYGQNDCVGCARSWRLTPPSGLDVTFLNRLLFCSSLCFPHSRSLYSLPTQMNFSCMDCKRKRKLADVKQEVIAGSVAYCRGPSCGGTLKPDITFFGELLPQPFFKAIKHDVSKCDLVIVIGTSLKVGGSVHLLLKHVEDRVPQVVTITAIAPSRLFSVPPFDSLSLLINTDFTVSTGADKQGIRGAPCQRIGRIRRLITG